MTPVWSDISELTIAFTLFPLILLLPGYAAGKLTGVLRFDKESGQFAKSLLLSLALCPWATYVLQRFIGLEAVWGFFILCGVVSTVFLLRGARGMVSDVMKIVSLRKVVFAVAAFFVVALMMVDLQDGGRLLRPLMSHDYVKHVAVTDAITRTGLPPVNPSFYPGEGIQLFYYYFWFLLCSIVDVLGGSLVNARAAVLASILWCGIALIALVRLYVPFLVRRGFKGIGEADLKWAYLLLLVTGLDIIPVAMNAVVYSMAGRNVLPDILWWNDIVASWNSGVLWVPHHVGAFICCMVAFVPIIERDPDQRMRMGPSLLLVSVALATSLGMSIWVTIVASFVLIAWFVFALIKKWTREALFLVVAGVISLLIALPFILDIQQSNNLEGFPIAFRVRPFYNLDLMLRDLNPILLNTLNFVLLPVNYLLELGFLLIGARVYWVYRKGLNEALNKTEWFLVMTLASSLFFCTFFRSAIINNDLGWRGFMFVQWVLLIYAIPLTRSLFDRAAVWKLELLPTTKQLAHYALVLSFLMLSLELYIRRFRPWGPNDADTAATRVAHEWADENLQKDIVIQHNPETNIEYFHALYGNRQVAVADHLYGRLYGVDENRFDSTYAAIIRLFKTGVDIEGGLAVVDQYGIEALLVKRSDPIWYEPDSWVSRLPIVYENSCCKVYMIPDKGEVSPVNGE